MGVTAIKMGAEMAHRGMAAAYGAQTRRNWRRRKPAGSMAL